MPEVHPLDGATWANLWWCEPVPVVDNCHGTGYVNGYPEQGFCRGCSWCKPPEHPGGYVVEVDGSQWDTGFKTLTEAVNFVAWKAKNSSVVLYDLEYKPLSWKGRHHGDETISVCSFCNQPLLPCPHCNDEVDPDEYGFGVDGAGWCCPPCEGCCGC